VRYHTYKLTFSEPKLELGLYWRRVKVDSSFVSVAAERLCEAGSEIETTFHNEKDPVSLKTRDPFTLAIVLLTKSRRAFFTLLGFVDFQRPSA